MISSLRWIRPKTGGFSPAHEAQQTDIVARLQQAVAGNRTADQDSQAVGHIPARRLTLQHGVLNLGADGQEAVQFNFDSAHVMDV